MMSMRSFAAELAEHAETNYSQPAQRALRLVIYLEYQPIIRQLDVARQACVRFDVSQLVTDVREVGPVGADARGGIDRFGHAEMRRVRAVAQRVEPQRAHALQERPRRIGNLAAIGEVRK